MYNVLFSLLLVLTMPEQIGVQSGARVGIHNHSTISQGGRIFTEERIIGANITTPVTLNAAAKQEAGAVFVLLKQIRINEITTGSLTVYFNVRRGAGAGNVESEVRLNGVAVGASWLEDPGLAGLQHSRVVPNDLIVGNTLEVWGRTAFPAFIEIWDMYLEYSYGILQLSDRVMNPVLGTNYAVPILQTNVL